MEQKIRLLGYFFLIVFSLVQFSCGYTFGQDVFLVKDIIDGDTIRIENGELVRYLGIDTPELHTKKEGKWYPRADPFAEEAKDYNFTLLNNKEVRLEYDTVQRDKYNRLLAYVYIDGERMVNAEIVRQGYATVSFEPPNLKYMASFVQMQKEAKENNRALWASANARIISPQEAKNYFGKFKTVEGKISNVYEDKKIVILEVEESDLKVIILKTNLELFQKEGTSSVKDYTGKRVRVSGLIKKYKQQPEIVVHHPSLLEIVE